MNKLKNHTTYLIGPMDDVADRGKVWRNLITPELQKFNLEILNPCDKPPDAGVDESEDTYAELKRLKETGQYHLIREKYADIRSFDLRCCDRADFGIAYINMDVHMCGSYEEITTMNRSKKPVLVFAKGGRTRIPNWIYWMLPHQHLFDDMKSLLDYLGVIDETGMDITRRWKLWARQYSA